MNPCEVTVHTQKKKKKKKKAENVDAAKRQETRKPNTHIEFSIEAGFSELVIEGDNVNVMVAVSCSSVNHSLLGHIFEDVHYYLCGLQFASISLIRGGGGVVGGGRNKVAHTLLFDMLEILLMKCIG